MDMLHGAITFARNNERAVFFETNAALDHDVFEATIFYSRVGLDFAGFDSTDNLAVLFVFHFELWFVNSILISI